jgi:hypothetical protein
MGRSNAPIVFMYLSQPSRTGASSLSKEAPGGVKQSCSPSVASKTVGSLSSDSDDILPIESLFLGVVLGGDG